MPMMNISQIIQSNFKGKTQEQIAAATGLAQSTVSRLMRDKPAWVHPITKRKLEDAMGCARGYIDRKMTGRR